VQDAKLIVVESCGSRPEAELVRGALEEVGIPAIIQGDTAGGMREHLAWSGAGFKILVREDDATAARDFLISLAKGDDRLDADSETGDDSLPRWRRFS
jgi:F420-dependent methylenetetrahydromethanopterin dehydrogenase